MWWLRGGGTHAVPVKRGVGVSGGGGHAVELGEGGGYETRSTSGTVQKGFVRVQMILYSYNFVRIQMILYSYNFVRIQMILYSYKNSFVRLQNL